jgi:hypothetical protein
MQSLANIKLCRIANPTGGCDSRWASEKMHEIRTHAGHPDDWSQRYTESDLLTIISREIAFSQYLQSESARYHFRYFDTLRKFIPTLDEVVAYVREA